MQRLLFVLILGALIVSSCKKTPGEATRFALHNATLNVDSLTLLWNGATAVSNLAEGKTSGTASEPYISLPAGTNSIVLKSGSTVLLDKNAFGGVNTSYTMLAYDSTPATTSLTFLFLTDNLSFPLADSLYAEYRFINCVYAEVDSVLLRNAADTLNITTTALFIGPNPAIASLQTFNTIPRGVYQPLIFKNSNPTPLAYDSVTLGRLQICSMIYSGVPGSTGRDSLKLRVIYHPAN